jgi:hypothetical protein
MNPLIVVQICFHIKISAKILPLNLKKIVLLRTMMDFLKKMYRINTIKLMSSSRPRKHGQFDNPDQKTFIKIALSAPTVYKKLSKATPWSPLVEVRRPMALSSQNTFILLKAHH